MLTMAKVSNAAEAADYYEGAADQGYYSEDGKAASNWLGKGAALIGLNGSVDAEQFKQLLEGKIPDGSVIHNAADGRRLGTDLTFSAPKSVSMQALIGGDARLIDAHDRAVEKALKYVEGLASYRVTENGVTQTEKSGNVLVASFRHDTNRNLDPNLHTHAISINATQRPDGQWRALDVSEVYRQQKLVGALYRSELALNIRELGYEVRQTHTDGRFELNHITREQVEVFSSRSQAIEARLAERGKTRDTASTAEKQMITLATREAKQEVDRAELRAQWRDKSASLGVNYQPDLAQKLGRSTDQAAVKNAVNYAVAHNSERQSVVPETKIIQHALEHGTGSTNLQDIKTEIQRQVASGELIRSGERYTTEEAQQREREMLGIEARGRNTLQPITDKAQVEARLKQTALNVGQQAAAGFICSNEHCFVAIQGSAGVGKTTLLKEAQILINEKGFQMLGVAPSTAAANELSARGIDSQTLARLRTDEYRSLNEKTVLVVDEASMVSTKDMHNLLQAAEEKQTRVILLGDVQQLASVEAGRPFAQLQDAGIPCVRVGEIVRQKDKELKQAIELAAQGNIGKSLELLNSKIKEIEYSNDRHAQIAQDYVKLSPEARAETLIVAGTNVARSAINDKVREGLGLAGKGVEVTTLSRKDLTKTQAKMSQSYQVGDQIQALKNYSGMGLERGDTATVKDIQPGRITLEKSDGTTTEWRPAIETKLTAYRLETKEFAVGDEVRVTQNDHALGIANGDRGTVTEIHDDRLTLTLNNNKTVSLNTADAMHLDHGYCQTVHASQGQTVRAVLIEADTNSLTSNENAFYVAISRAESQVTIYTNDREMLPQAMGRENEKSAALDLEKSDQMAM